VSCVPIPRSAHPDRSTLADEIATWRNNRNNRNNSHTKANWQFTATDARIRLKRLPGTLGDSGH